MGAFDILYRYLKHLQYDAYICKFTDIDDNVIRQAKDIGEDDDPVALNGRFSREFLRDMDDLKILRIKANLDVFI